MTTNDTIYDIEVCIDCGSLLANGELPEDNPGFKLSPRWDGYQVVLNCDEDGCEGFSKSPCDGCDSRLGGNRHKAAAWLL